MNELLKHFKTYSLQELAESYGLPEIINPSDLERLLQLIIADLKAVPRP